MTDRHTDGRRNSCIPGAFGFGSSSRILLFIVPKSKYSKMAADAQLDVGPFTEKKEPGKKSNKCEPLFGNAFDKFCLITHIRLTVFTRCDVVGRDSPTLLTILLTRDIRTTKY
jgi:hypothetical protein